jgi:hypothetical protein
VTEKRHAGNHPERPEKCREEQFLFGDPPPVLAARLTLVITEQQEDLCIHSENDRCNDWERTLVHGPVELGTLFLPYVFLSCFMREKEPLQIPS